MRTIFARPRPAAGMIAGVSLVALSAACSTPTVPEPDAVSTATRRVDRSITRGVDVANDLGAFGAVLRFNPGECECPPFELAIGDRWERVALVPARDADQEVLNWLEDPSDSLQSVVEITRDEARSEIGWGYRTLLIGVPQQTVPTE